MRSERSTILKVENGGGGNRELRIFTPEPKGPLWVGEILRDKKLGKGDGGDPENVGRQGEERDSAWYVEGEPGLERWGLLSTKGSAIRKREGKV